jgi:CheY-like chemotaxis protein
MSIKVLLADDTAIMRSAIRHLLEEQPEIELVAEASDFNQTIALTRKFKPQVVERFLPQIVECREEPSHGDEEGLLVRLAYLTPFLI